MTPTLYWHDYETSGLDHALDRPLQFAAIRTNHALEIIAEPQLYHARPGCDLLIDPQVERLIGFNPLEQLENGIDEVDLSELIYQEMIQAHTCSVGYNSVRFDDEITRHLFYRNFLPIYDREWRDGNSRWDLLDVVRMMHDLRPDGINWCYHSDGKNDFRLESLANANQLWHPDHPNAHNALADVYATIHLAQKIRQAQPKLFDYCLKNHTKEALRHLVDPITMPLLVHTSGMLRNRYGSTALVTPLMQHPERNNSIICWNCSQDPQMLTDLSSDRLRTLLYTAKDQLGADEIRPALKEIHLNRGAVVAPAQVLLANAERHHAERLHIDIDQVQKHHQWLIQHQNAVRQQLSEIYRSDTDPTVNKNSALDVEQQLYQGFFDNADQKLIPKVRQTPPDELAEQPWHFNDPRLDTLLFRFRARNYAETLTPDEQQQWSDFCRQRLKQAVAEDQPQSRLDDYLTKIAQQRHQLESELKQLDQLQRYGEELANHLNHTLN